MTTTSTPSTKTLAVAEVVFTDAERVALAGFLAGYRGLTRDAYALDLRQFVSWCERHGLKLFSVRRSDIELYARHLEETGRARATVARRLCTVAGFYPCQRTGRGSAGAHHLGRGLTPRSYRAGHGRSRPTLR